MVLVVCYEWVGAFLLLGVVLYVWQSGRVNMHPCVQGQSCVFSYGNELQNNKEQSSRGDVDVRDGFDCQTMIFACSLDWSSMSDSFRPVSSCVRRHTRTSAASS